ncbi:chymotrypsin B1 [Cordyceps fumosorosea ARSEF 2679]|uniref:Chymotrypsin B1 n=1 Tax=Cordyceps fumosorosea (strain ARSEF 2679) TaxID=1081104 RepID=A0A167NKK2_CORFA|nr:chymotrypsin B1 [Cordyceps fumosorosea ARSEF 2679]OAA55652.1 chymotrypsin B1 [Cordyceps fumosorosea ARSEF 2679]
MSLKAAITLAISFSAILASSATVDKRIVNGEDADFGEIKFIVTLCEQDGECYCGGSLLDSTTVLTAAHCVDHSNPISIKAGILFRGIGGGVDAQPASIIKHPNYRAGYDKYGMIMPGPQQHNDIAILKLATPIDKSSDIDYATLPPAGSDAVVNSTATAAGWGRDIPDKPTANVVESPIWLQKVVLPIRAREDCAQYENVGERDTIICAGGGGKNVCGGDSGGPLFDAKTGQLLGVVSMATKDKDNDEEMCNQTPGVFTRVGSYIDFINEHLGSKTKQ